ncbi:SH3 domain-containing protein [Streptomyces sp. NRRL F-2664]|uniref:SH3 domain-containing protein n=1 Tax=Streptomyces sp. NRRL F-2664 TaxID=1463842 RepID=UPI000D142799|nr:SH3 domain-containing protein [Streptomyces sp. NRRL F-2664]
MNTRRLLTTATAAAATLTLGTPTALASPTPTHTTTPTTLTPTNPTTPTPPATTPTATRTAAARTAGAAGTAGTAGVAASVYIWATNVNVRYDAADADCVHHPSRTSCTKIVATVSRTAAEGMCQHPGEEITDSGYRNRWWTLLKLPNGTIGWVNNIYLQGGEKIAGIPDCGW